jgi:hypothetical protein
LPDPVSKFLLLLLLKGLGYSPSGRSHKHKALGSILSTAQKEGRKKVGKEGRRQEKRKGGGEGRKEDWRMGRA